jgi:hypothetical protein
MDKSLIDSIVKLTGKTEDEVQEKLANIPIDDIYKLNDLVRQGDKASIIDFIDPIRESAYFRKTNEGLEYTAKFKTQTAKDQLVDWLEDENIPYTNRLNNVIVVDCADRDVAYKLSRKVTQLRASVDTNLQTFKDMAQKPPKPGTPVPKPRDPMAKALALPQYQPKATPSKKGIQDKAERKHKGRTDYTEHLDLDADLIEEGVMGMTGMDSMLPRLLTLAGRPPMEDEMDMPIIQCDDDMTISSVVDVPLNDVEVQEIPEPVNHDISNSLPEWATMEHIRMSFKQIQAGLGDIKVSEFAEVRNLMADLMSQIDRMGNSITGK